VKGEKNKMSMDIEEKLERKEGVSVSMGILNEGLVKSINTESYYLFACGSDINLAETVVHSTPRRGREILLDIERMKLLGQRVYICGPYTSEMVEEMNGPMRRS